MFPRAALSQYKMATEGWASFCEAYEYNVHQSHNKVTDNAFQKLNSFSKGGSTMCRCCCSVPALSVPNMSWLQLSPVGRCMTSLKPPLRTKNNLAKLDKQNQSVVAPRGAHQLWRSSSHILWVCLDELLISKDRTCHDLSNTKHRWKD